MTPLVRNTYAGQNYDCHERFPSRSPNIWSGLGKGDVELCWDYGYLFEFREMTECLMRLYFCSIDALACSVVMSLEI